MIYSHVLTLYETLIAGPAVLSGLVWEVAVQFLTEKLVDLVEKSHHHNSLVFPTVTVLIYFAVTHGKSSFKQFVKLCFNGLPSLQCFLLDD